MSLSSASLPEMSVSGRIMASILGTQQRSKHDVQFDGPEVVKFQFDKMSIPNGKVGTAIKLRDGRSGIRIMRRKIYFYLLQNVQTGSRAHPASYSMGNRRVLLVMKRTARDIGHSPPSSAMVMTKWSYTSAPSIRLQDVDMNFTSLFSTPDRMTSELKNIAR